MRPIPFLVSLALVALACAGAAPGRETPRPGAGTVEYRMVASPVSGVEMPRIRLPERPEVEQQVNAQLDAEAADLRCMDGDVDANEGWWESSVSVTYAMNDVFSVSIASNFYCGGAHPMNDADSSQTFDLRTGRSVRFRSLFEDYDRDAAEIERAYLSHLTAEDREGCEDVLTAEGLEGHYFAYTIAPEGVRMRTSFPHVIEACNRTAVVPFAELRAYARPGGILVRLADAAARS